ncbi:Hypothetical protein L291_0246 [Acinetobacter guillouiae MSP4-18]|uniref:hypothetical protein n=1 Tax=Acinetobacter guillouiae TaxID=106649 RepID=UPI0002D10C11|nr:hypothetical protein [Acinetobacter guillouiae]ENU57369.1 hypothetical protein F981_03597 [Acinetobacter guillouiae CIP 63.46]EPH37555.1 Hypothetical protein L291_0246 [Acinetobacter guillouiae MSP4-18]KAB0624913.1 hypothetical protein F7P82_17060 [Acinetobacter guillouiae]
MELQVLEQNVIVSAFNNANGIQAIVDQIKVQVSSIVPDVTTAKGRKEITSLAYKVAQSKSAIDAEGKKLKEQYTVVTNKIDADRKFARDELDAERDRIRQPLTDWENAEKDRVAKHEAAIQEIKHFANNEFLITAYSSLIEGTIAALNDKVIDSPYEEYEEQAKLAKFETLEKLRKALSETQALEAERAELERLRQAEIERQQKERDEKIAREAADKARVEAEAKALADRKRAEQEKLEAEQREARLKLEKEQAELREQQLKQQAIEHEKQAEIDRQKAVEAERLRIEKEAQAKADAELKEQQAREANKAHKKKICNEALQGLVKLGVSEELGKQILQAIHKGEVPHVSIKF